MKKKPTKKITPTQALEAKLAIEMDAQEAAVVVKALLSLPLAMNDPLCTAAQRLLKRIQMGAQDLQSKQNKKQDAACG